MNSEITNIVKLSPVTVVKADKQTDERPSLDVKAKQAVAEPVSLNDLSSIAEKLKQDEENKAKSTQKGTNKPPLELVKKAADEGNALLQAVKRNLQFKVDDTTNELVVKIVDSESGELVRQIPSEEMLAFIKHMKEMEGLQGSMIQDRA